MVSPLASRIGHSRRPRNRSYADRPMRDQPGRDGLLVAERLLAEVREQGLAVARGEADPEPVRGVLVEAALVQELSSHQGVRAGQLTGIELLGDAVGLDQPAARRTLRTVVTGVAVLAPQLHAVLVGEPLDCLTEAEPVDLHQEGEDVATFLAAETVAGEDVVLEREGMPILDLGAEHLLARGPSARPTARPSLDARTPCRRCTNRSRCSSMRKKFVPQVLVARGGPDGAPRLPSREARPASAS